MNFEEYAAKPLLAKTGITIPKGILATTSEEAAKAAEEIGAVVVKAQVPTGKRGKAGGIKTADSVDEACTVAKQILGMTIGEHQVEKVLVESQADINMECYAAVLNDPASKGPMVMFSPAGGMDIEEIAETQPDQLRKQVVDITQGFDMPQALIMLDGLRLGTHVNEIAQVLCRLYQAYIENDAELLEINPLAYLSDGSLVALDCKFVLDDSAIKRRIDLSENGTPDKLTGLELEGEKLGLKYIELDGDVGVVANGAGLTMTTMDVVTHYGGTPANFLEIGGEAYTKATLALKLVLQNPKVKCLVVNFCGAFARTDVMTEGVINAWEELKPTLPVFFAIHGTGAAEARTMLKERLDMTPYPTMDEAIIAAVEAARAAA